MKKKIYKKTTARKSLFYLLYLDKLVDEYNSTYHCCIGKKHIGAYHYALTKEIATNLKAPKFKVNDRIRITKYNNIFSEGYIKNWSKVISLLILR